MEINSIALIVVTAFVNFAVSNYIFFRYQKKIETSFAKSLFEYQTKFVRNHEKTSDALDTLYKKYTEIKLGFGNILFKIETLYQSPDTKAEIESEIETLQNNTDNFRKYFYANRLYLPNEARDFIDNLIVLNVFLLTLASMTLLLAKDKINQSQMDVQHINLYIETLNDYFSINILPLDLNYPNIAKMVMEVINVTTVQMDRLDQFYKSVAEEK